MHIDASWRFPKNGGTQQARENPTTNDYFGMFWGYHHLRKHPVGFKDIFCSQSLEEEGWKNENDPTSNSKQAVLDMNGLGKQPCFLRKHS